MLFALPGGYVVFCFRPTVFFTNIRSRNSGKKHGANKFCSLLGRTADKIFFCHAFVSLRRTPDRAQRDTPLTPPTIREASLPTNRFARSRTVNSRVSWLKHSTTKKCPSGTGTGFPFTRSFPIRRSSESVTDRVSLFRSMGNMVSPRRP